MKVGLYVRITGHDGKRRYCTPVYGGNKKLKAGSAVVDKKPEAHPEAVFVLRYPEYGKRVWEEVGSDPAQALAAKRSREHLMRGREIGQPVSGDFGAIDMTTVAATKTPIAHAVKDYLTDLGRKSKEKTINAYSAALSFFASTVVPVVHVEDLTRTDIERYLKALYDLSVCSRTKANRIGYVKSFLLSRGLGSLVLRKDKPKYTKRAPNAYNQEFLRRLFAACDDEERAIFRFFHCTGCREQEVMHACWSDLDLVRGTLTVREKPDLGWTLKDYEERTIPLASDFVVELKARRKRRPHDRLIFPRREGEPDGHFLRKLKGAALRAGLNCGHCLNKKKQSCRTKPVCGDIELHRFRRTFATAAHEAGSSVRTIQRWLGHSNIETTMLYLASAEDDSPEVRKRLNQAFSFVA